MRINFLKMVTYDILDLTLQDEQFWMSSDVERYPTQRRNVQTRKAYEMDILTLNGPEIPFY